MNQAPIDTSITLDQLSADPYPIYRRLRSEAPVLRVKATGRTLLTKAADTKYVKDNPDLFSSNDPNTPMARGFRAHTLMRKDGAAHLRERMAMAPAFAPKTINNFWIPKYHEIADTYLGKLKQGDKINLVRDLSGPYAAAGLANLLGIEEATDAEMEEWSQALIEGAGNFGWREKIFARSDAANDAMDILLLAKAEKLRASPNASALSVMVNADDPIEWSQIVSNIKIAIGGGINEPRDALATAVVGLLENPDQLEEVKRRGDWVRAFEEAIRWVAPIQISSRLVTQDTEIRGFLVPKGDTLMTVQASANRDEEVVENGEVFDVYRDHVPHQSFGNGPHFCQGTHVARKAVAEIMLPLLFERFPNMTLAGDVVWQGFGFRGPTHLPVTL